MSGLLLVLMFTAGVVANVWVYSLVATIAGHYTARIVRDLVGDRAWLRWLALPAELHHELWPFALPGLLLSAVYEFLTRDWLQFGSALVMLAIWARTRNWPGDDDRWRRRRRKLAATVQRQGGRLVITPAPA